MSAVSSAKTVFLFFYRDAHVSSDGQIDRFAPADSMRPHTPLRLRVGEISRFCFAEKCRYLALAMKSMCPARRNVRNCPPLLKTGQSESIAFREQDCEALPNSPSLTPPETAETLIFTPNRQILPCVPLSNLTSREMFPFPSFDRGVNSPAQSTSNSIE